MYTRGKTNLQRFITKNMKVNLPCFSCFPLILVLCAAMPRFNTERYLSHGNPWNCIQSYVQESWENLIGLVLVESTTTGQETCLWCFVLTRFPITFPRDRISNSSVNGTLPLPVSETARLAPAPYKGSLFPWRITDTTRLLFLGW